MIEHTHLYSLIDNKGYRVPVPKTPCEMLAIENMTSKTRSSVLPSAKIFTQKVILNTTDFQKEKLSNRLYCDKVLNWVKDSKATVITDLRDSYKIQVDYLITSAADELIDEGVTTQTVEPKVVIMPTGVSEDNELGYRYALKFDKLIKFTKAFPASFGMLQQISGQYFLKIHGIKLLGISDLGVTDGKDQYIYPGILDNSGRMQVGITTAAHDGVCILDTTQMGITFDPEVIPFKPRELAIDLSIVLNEFCQYASEAELLAALAANDGGTSSDTPDGNGNKYPCHPNIHPHPPMNPCPDHWCPGCDKPLGPDNGDKPKPNPGDNDDDLIWALQPVDGTTPDDAVRYTVVDDSMSDDIFDKNTMVKLADAKKYITDVKVGDLVFWGWTWNM